MELLIEWYLKLLKNVENLVKTKQVIINTDLNKVRSLLYELKYSYYDSEYSQTLIKKIVEEVNQVRVTNWRSVLSKKLFEYFLEELKNLEKKQNIKITEPYQVFRFTVIKVLSVSKHPKFDKLYIIKGKDIKNNKIYTIVTNIKNVKVGELRPVVFLPPKDFKGVISEAMLVTEYPIKSLADIDKEDLKKLNQYFYSL